MPISPGERMPEGSFGVMTSEGPGQLTSDELFKGKKVVLFAVPGAFTPTCSINHLPGYVERATEFTEKGVDTIACMAVNDAFVMHAWGRDRGVADKVLMLADGNADYTRKLDLGMDASGFGMGQRCQRFALLIDDGVATVVNVEEPGQYEVSSAESMLAAL